MLSHRLINTYLRTYCKLKGWKLLSKPLCISLSIPHCVYVNLQAA